MMTLFNEDVLNHYHIYPRALKRANLMPMLFEQRSFGRRVRPSEQLGIPLQHLTLFPVTIQIQRVLGCHIPTEIVIVEVMLGITNTTGIGLADRRCNSRHYAVFTEICKPNNGLFFKNKYPSRRFQ